MPPVPPILCCRILTVHTQPHRRMTASTHPPVLRVTRWTLRSPCQLSVVSPPPLLAAVSQVAGRRIEIAISPPSMFLSQIRYNRHALRSAPNRHQRRGRRHQSDTQFRCNPHRKSNRKVSCFRHDCCDSYEPDNQHSACHANSRRIHRNRTMAPNELLRGMLRRHGWRPIQPGGGRRRHCG